METERLYYFKEEFIMLTNGQHDDLWIGAFSKIPVISDSLRRANGLTIAKELYSLGELTRDQYVGVLHELAHNEGFSFEFSNRE